MQTEEVKFEDWYHTEWIKHISDSGGIKAQIKLLTWLVGALLTANIATIGFLITIISD